MKPWRARSGGARAHGDGRFVRRRRVPTCAGRTHIGSRPQLPAGGPFRTGRQSSLFAKFNRGRAAAPKVCQLHQIVSSARYFLLEHSPPRPSRRPLARPSSALHEMARSSLFRRLASVASRVPRDGASASSLAPASRSFPIVAPAQSGVASTFGARASVATPAAALTSRRLSRRLFPRSRIV